MMPSHCEVSAMAHARPRESPRQQAPTSTDLVSRAVTLAGSQKALAYDMRVTKARISRIVHGARLSVANCLLLAVVLDEDPALVLRAYRYSLLGDCLQRLYRARNCVPSERARVHEALDQLHIDDCRFVGRLIDRLLPSGMSITPRTLASPRANQQGGAR